MNKNGHSMLRYTAVVVFAAICLAAYLATGSRPSGQPPWYSVVPPLLAITMALARRARMFAVSVVGRRD